MSSIRADDGLFFELLIPDFADPNDQDVQPTVRRVPLQLPPDATLGALRAAALRCGGREFGNPEAEIGGSLGDIFFNSPALQVSTLVEFVPGSFAKGDSCLVATGHPWQVWNLEIALFIACQAI